MSDDLISRKVLIENLNRFASEHYSYLVNDLITKQPAAFDKGKVLKELQHASNVSRVHWEKHDDMGAFHEMRAFESAIEIVEKGGIE